MSPSSQSSDLYYTRQEILDYLPGGWALSDPSDAGSWNSKKRRWESSVRDIADVEWELLVDARRAESDGRVEALKHAIDQLYRAALGKSGFFG